MARKKAEPTFEVSINRLEEIVRLMEQGDLPLEESLKLLEEGTALVRRCDNLLESAQQKITMITLGEDGQPEETEVAFHE
jgi:exodeoxyribonuclease VII small subunit